MKHATLFLDESGKSSLAEKSNEPFVLTGVILAEDEIPPVEGFFTYIKSKFKIDTNRPFHSYHIFEHPTTKLTPAKATELVGTLADFVSLIPIKVNIISIDKTIFKKSLGVKVIKTLKAQPSEKR